MGGTDVPNEQAWAPPVAGAPSTPMAPGAVPPVPAPHPRTGPATMGSVYSGYPSGKAPSRSRTAMSTLASLVWAVLPLPTFGLAAPFTIGYAAHRLHSRALTLSASIYTAVFVAAFVLIGSSTTDTQWQTTVGAWLMAGVAVGSTVQSFVIREQLVAGRPGHDVVVGEARQSLRQRDASRRIVDHDPVLARELLIGRPDLPRRFDDGGLVDVNHVPVDLLATLPGLDRAVAELIVDVRDGIGGFESLDDLSVTLHLPPHSLDGAAGRMIFIR